MFVDSVSTLYIYIYIILNSVFFLSEINCHTKVKEHSLSYNLHIAGERIVECIPFSEVLVLHEMQPVSSRF